MATIITDAGSERELRTVTTLGRHKGSDFVLTGDDVSREHAKITWDSKRGVWELADLESRNGTQINGLAAAPRAPVRLKAGDKIYFGSPACRWTLKTAAPPRAFICLGERDVLLETFHGFPIDRDPAVAPIATLNLDAEGRWVLHHERGAETDEVILGDRERFGIEGEGVWEIHLPDELPPTQPKRRAFRDYRLDVSASTDLESAFIATVTDKHTLECVDLGFGPAAGAVLYWLGKASTKAPDTIGDHEGCLTVPALCRELGVDSNALNVRVHRIRDGFSRVGFENPRSVIDRQKGRRKGGGRLRILPELSVETHQMTE